jgi:hypothetical protein
LLNEWMKSTANTYNAFTMSATGQRSFVYTA